ncbi:MAG TPA: branched-chain amino acid ABC transporter permease [Ktedonobacterales bacterium]|nr:branched-chain amino acid ABC transporter permease [Ktedonobacterales bacterium]
MQMTQATQMMRSRVRSWYGRARPFVAVLTCIVVVAILMIAPYMLTGFYLNVLTEILIYGLLAMSINILMGYTGLTSLGHAAFFGLSAYAGAYLMLTSHATFLTAFLVGLAIATFASVVFGAIALRATGIYFLMITLALNMLVFGTAFTFSPITGAENGLYGVTRPDFIFEDYQFYWFTLVVIIASTILIWRLVRSPFGLTLMGIRESESRMRTLGYNVFLHKLIAFTISGFFAGLAGCLYVFFRGGVSPATVDLPVSVEGVLEVIIGGMGTLFGPVLGATIIVVARELVSLQVGRWPTILGVVLIVIVLFARNGILGAYQEWRARRRGQAGSEASEPAQSAPGTAGETGTQSPSNESLQSVPLSDVQ